MDKDIYLGLAAELYEKGTWDKDTFIKKVTLYAKESKIEEKQINKYIRRVTKEKEYSIDEKRNFLSVLTIDGHELKYGDIVKVMTEENIEKFYDMEVALLSNDKINEYHILAKVKSKNHDSVTPVLKIETEKSKIDVKPIEEAPKLTEEPEEIDVYQYDFDNSKENVIPSLDFEEQDVPQTEDEFQNQAKKITEPEKDSNVTIVNETKERIEKLKKGKGKVLNYALKTLIIIVSLILLSASSSITLIGGYLFFSDKIKRGEFNPKNSVGKAIKAGVEKIMYMGMTKNEIENERGKTR